MVAQLKTIGFPAAVAGSSPKWLYGGIGEAIAESGTTANHYTGTRCGGRIFYQDSTQILKNSSAQDYIHWRGGCDTIVTVSNFSQAGANYGSVLAGGSIQTTWEANWNAAFDRIYALPFNSAVGGGNATLDGYGGLTRGKYRLGIMHEFDRPDKANYGTPAQYINMVERLKTLAGNRATAAGKSASLIEWDFIVTSTGCVDDRIVPYFVNGVWDALGSDIYIGFNGSWVYSGSLPVFATMKDVTKSVHYADLWNLNLLWPEFGVAESGNDTQMQNYFDSIRDYFSSLTTVTCDGIWFWGQASNQYQNYNYKTTDDGYNAKGHIGKHNGIMDIITTFNSNATTTSTVQQKATNPTGLSVSFSADGTKGTGVWAANPAGDNVTAWRFYVNQKKVLPANGLDLPLTPRSFTFDTVPGTTYNNFNVTAVNSAGNSGFSNDPGPLTAPNPGPTNNSPTVSVSVTQDPTNLHQINWVITATSPISSALHYSFKLTAPDGSALTFPTQSGNHQYASEGIYGYSAVVVDSVTPTPNQNSVSGTIAITFTGLNTDNRGYPRVAPGLKFKEYGPLLRSLADGVDRDMDYAVNRKSNSNSLHNFAASAMDPAACAGTFTFVANQVLWANMLMEGDTLYGAAAVINTLLVVSSGVSNYAVTLHHPDGRLLTEDTNTFTGTDVDAWLKGTTAQYIFPQPIAFFNPGDFVLMGLWSLAIGTVTQQVGIGQGSSSANAGRSVNRTIPRFGVVSSASAVGDINVSGSTATPCPGLALIDNPANIN